MQTALSSILQALLKALEYIPLVLCNYQSLAM